MDLRGWGRRDVQGVTGNDFSLLFLLGLAECFWLQSFGFSGNQLHVESLETWGGVVGGNGGVTFKGWISVGIELGWDLFNSISDFRIFRSFVDIHS